MIILDATTHSLQLVTTGTSQIDYVAGWSDGDTTSLVTGSTQGSITTATTTTVVPAPSGVIDRELKFLSLRNAGAATNTVTLKKDVGGTSYALTADVPLLPGEALQFAADGGFKVKSASGADKVSESYKGRTKSLLVSPAHNASLVGVKGLGSTGGAYCGYLGKAPADLTSIKLYYRVTTAAGTVTWAEIAVAKSDDLHTLIPATDPKLTTVGFADIAADVVSVGVKSKVVSVAAGQAIKEGDNLWAVLSCSATTALSVRSLNIADDLQAVPHGAVATTRPSLFVGQVFSYPVEGITLTDFWIVAFA